MQESCQYALLSPNKHKITCLIPEETTDPFQVATGKANQLF